MRVWFVRGCVVLVVLAVGIGLGAGPLQHSARQRDRELAAEKRAVAHARTRIAALTGSVKYASDFAAATAPAVVAGKLSGRTIGLLLLPGADPTTVAAVRAVLVAAGATVSTQVSWAPTLADGGSRQLVEALTSQMVTQYPGLPVPAEASGYTRLGVLLARAFGADHRTGTAGAAYDQTAVGIVSGLQAADLISGVKVAPRASLTVAIAGPPATNKDAAAGNAVPLTILRAYAAGTPTVLAGTGAAAGPFGLLGALRADRAAASALTGVDSVDTPLGQVAVVLALVARVHGTVGQYGGVGASGGPIPAPR